MDIDIKLKRTFILLFLTLGFFLAKAQHVITIKHTYYTMTYDTAQKSELIGFYVQTKAHAMISCDSKQAIDRTSVAIFKEDPLIDKYIQDIVTNKAYSDWNAAHPNQRIDKGHVVPYSAMDFDMTAALESMYIENTCPQASRFNEHQWEQVEMYVLKTVALVYGDTKVWTGVLISVSHPKRINQMYMPDYYWKVIQYTKNGKTVEEAWLGVNDWSNTDTNPNDIVADPAHVKQVILQYYPKLNLDF